MSGAIFRRSYDGTKLAAVGTVTTDVQNSAAECPQDSLAEYVKIDNSLIVDDVAIPIRVTVSCGGAPFYAEVGTTFQTRENLRPESMAVPQIKVEILAPGVTFADVNGGELIVTFGWRTPDAAEDV